MQRSASNSEEIMSSMTTETSLQIQCDIWNPRSSSLDLDTFVTSADSLDLLATAASLHGQDNFSLSSIDDGGSLDILAAAALVAGVPTDTSDSVCPILNEDGPRGVKRKREDDDEVVSLEDDLYLSDTDDDDSDDDDSDDYDGDDDDTEYESDSDVIIGQNQLIVNGFKGKAVDEAIVKESIQVSKFGSVTAVTDVAAVEAYNDDDDDDSSDDSGSSYDSDSDSSEESDSDDEMDCSDSCVCNDGSQPKLPPINRTMRVISPLYKKLLKYRLLRNVNRFLHDCCGYRCLRRWRRMPRYRVTVDYEEDDLRVYNFRWGTWKPEDENDEIFW